MEVDTVTPAAADMIASMRRWLVTLGGHFEVCGASGPTSEVLRGALKTPMWRKSLAAIIEAPPTQGRVADDVSIGFEPNARSAKAAR